MKQKWSVVTRKHSATAVKSTHGSAMDEYDDVPLWLCAYCGFEDKSINGLKIHLSQPHTHDQDDLFERCKMLKENTEGQQFLKCIVCFARAIKPAMLKRHLRGHSKG